MVTELTNKFNQVVTIRLVDYFTIKSTDPSLTPAQQAEYLQALNEFKLNIQKAKKIYNKRWFNQTIIINFLCQVSCLYNLIKFSILHDNSLLKSLNITEAIKPSP